MTRKESNCVAELELLAEPAFAPAQGNAAVTPPPQRSIASIAVFEDCLIPLQDALGVTLPGRGGQARKDNILYLWSGPENWLAVAAEDDPDFDLELANRCNGLAAVTDQSDGRTILQIKGPAVRDALAKLLPIDLHPSAFPPDATALTLAANIPVQIWQSAEDVFELACFRSYAETLYEALVEASRV
jgi:heterotetrameric sarcosine oxidase gamma subunit